MKITTKMIANMQVEQQHNNKQLFNELRNVDADAQRFAVSLNTFKENQIQSSTGHRSPEE